MTQLPLPTTYEPRPEHVGIHCVIPRIKTPCALCGCKDSATRLNTTTDERVCLDGGGCLKRLWRQGR